MAKNEKSLVLVADDEPSTLALVANHLRSRGYRVIEATDGDEAWNAATRELPDLVVLDVMMPGMSGWEVCRKIREAVSLAHTGVVMLTGIGDTLNELTSPLYGADAYLDKPFQFTKLAELVETTLTQRSGGNLGRPKSTSGPTTRLYKTSLNADEEPESTKRPKKAKAAAAKEKPAAAPAEEPKKPVKAAKKAAPEKAQAAKKAGSPAATAPLKAKPAPKKAVKKRAPEKAVKKPAPKKAVKKPAPKKAVKKPAPKKAVKKPAPKKAVKKPAPKKAVKKPARGAKKAAPVKAKAAKKPAKKSAPKKPAKKSAPKKAAKKK